MTDRARCWSLQEANMLITYWLINSSCRYFKRFMLLSNPIFIAIELICLFVFCPLAFIMVRRLYKMASFSIGKWSFYRHSLIIAMTCTDQHPAFTEGSHACPGPLTELPEVEWWNPTFLRIHSCLSKCQKILSIKHWKNHSASTGILLSNIFCTGNLAWRCDG